MYILPHEKVISCATSRNEYIALKTVDSTITCNVLLGDSKNLIGQC